MIFLILLLFPRYPYKQNEAKFPFHPPFALLETRCWLKYFIRERWYIARWKLSTKLDNENERKIRVNIWTINLEETIPRFEQKATIYFQVYIYISEIENRISAFLHGLIIFHWRRPIKPFNRAGNWLPGRRSARSDRDSFVIDRIDRPLSSLYPRSSKDYDRYTDTDAYTRTRNSFRKRFSLSERVRISGVMLDISRMERMPRKSLAV